MTFPLSQRRIRFPASGHIWIPAHGRRAAAAGVSMHSPCHPLKVLAQRGLYAATRVLGPAVIPGERAAWEPPAPEREWEALVDAWRAIVPDVDDVALYRRPQSGRAGFALLLLQAGRGRAFARVHPDAERVRREHEVLSGIHGARPTTFSAAAPLAVGETMGWGWMLSTSLPNHPLDPLHDATTRDAVAAEISDVLAGVLPRPAGTPDHWVPAHGDFTPWNVRRDGSRVYVIDWEDAGYAPPHVDALYGALTAHTTFGDPLPAAAPAEAREWIAAIVENRIATEPEAREGNTRMRDLLRSIPVA